MTECICFSACCLESVFRRRASAAVERFGDHPSTRGGRMMTALALNRPKKQKRARNLGKLAICVIKNLVAQKCG